VSVQSELGPQAEVFKPCPMLHVRGYAWPVSSSPSDRFHRLRVARPEGYLPGITSAEPYRVASLID
jgi:hypothetical protein